MAGEVVNSNFGLLNEFGTSRQEIAPKTATSHMRKTLWASLKSNNDKADRHENHRSCDLTVLDCYD